MIDCEDLAAVKEKLRRDNMSMPVLVEAVLRGYVNNHPAVLAMIEDWIRERDSSMAGDRPRLFRRRSDLDEIYGAIQDERRDTDVKG